MYRRRLLGQLGLLSGTAGLDREPLGRLVEPGQETATAHQFSGERAGFSEPVGLTDGVTTVDIEHTGESAVGVSLVEADSTEARQLLNDDSGRTAGTVFLAVDGEYRFGVTTAGGWRIECVQPAASTVGQALPPQSATGEGSSYLDPVLLNRTTELTATHSGDGAFRVTGYTEGGERQQLIDDTGAVESWTTTDLSGAVWFAVEATGEWQLEVF